MAGIVPYPPITWVLIVALLRMAGNHQVDPKPMAKTRKKENSEVALEDQHGHESRRVLQGCLDGTCQTQHPQRSADSHAKNGTEGGPL